MSFNDQQPTYGSAYGQSAYGQAPNNASSNAAQPPYVAPKYGASQYGPAAEVKDNFNLKVLSIVALSLAGVLLLISFLPFIGLIAHLLGFIPLGIGIYTWIYSARNKYQNGVNLSIATVCTVGFALFVAISATVSSTHQLMG